MKFIGPRAAEVMTFLDSKRYLLETTVNVMLWPVVTPEKLKKPSELVGVLIRVPVASTIETIAFLSPWPEGVNTWPVNSIVAGPGGTIARSVPDTPDGELKSYSRTRMRAFVVETSGTVNT